MGAVKIPNWAEKMIREDPVAANADIENGALREEIAKALGGRTVGTPGTVGREKVRRIVDREIKKHSLTEEEEHELAKVLQRTSEMSDEEKQALLRRLSPGKTNGKARSQIEREQGERIAAKTRAPRNNDELWNFIRNHTGYEIPRVAVCEDHQAMFDPIADAYFNRERAILVIASRAAGKTISVSILHWCNAVCKPGIEGVTFGAILPQAKRAYRYIKQFIYVYNEDGERIISSDIAGDPTRERTEWKSGSSIEVLVGSKSGVNSPHPQVVHADEIDLMEEEIFEESANMSTSGKTIDGKHIPALDFGTTTRKSMKGLAQKLINEIEEAVREGHRPPRKLYVSCYKEAAAEVPMCRRADPIERVRRLVQLGRDPRDICFCETVVKGDYGTRVDEDGVERPVPRTLESCCRGDLFKSRGWMPYEDIVGKFMNNSQAVWEAQMECRRPMADGLYLPNFSRDRHCVRGWVPRPEYGKLWIGVDWGGSAPSVVTFGQGALNHPVQIRGYDGREMIVPQGAYVIFDEIVAPGIGASKLADLVCIKESSWRQRFPGWRIRGRFTDMAGRQQREDWHEHSPPLRTHWYISRDFDPTVEALQDLIGDSMLYLDVTMCSSLCDDFESWRQKNGREIHDASSHGPSSARYMMANVVVLERKERRRGEAMKILPVVREREAFRQPASPAAMGPDGVGYERPPTSGGGMETSGVQSENWRRSFGHYSGDGDGADGWRTG